MLDFHFMRHTQSRNRSKKVEAKGKQTGTEHFSIADGVDTEEEVSLASPGSQGVEGTDVGLSSDELLKQLTLAEQEMDQGIASRYATPTEEVDLRIADEDVKPSTASSAAAAAATRAADVKAGVEETSAESELTALEEPLR